MAEQKPEQPDKADEIKTAAAEASSVPQLRDQVVELTALVETLLARVARLERRR